MPAKKSKTTAERLCEYVKAMEKETGKIVVSARIEGRAFVLDFQGRNQGSNPADLIEP